LQIAGAADADYAGAYYGGLRLGHLRKIFFFEKKKQKTFAHWASASPERLGPEFKSFLVLFFKKELLAFYHQ
jgi:hypothetical protein